MCLNQLHVGFCSCIVPYRGAGLRSKSAIDELGSGPMGIQGKNMGVTAQVPSLK